MENIHKFLASEEFCQMTSKQLRIRKVSCQIVSMLCSRIVNSLIFRLKNPSTGSKLQGKTTLR